MRTSDKLHSSLWDLAEVTRAQLDDTGVTKFVVDFRKKEAAEKSPYQRRVTPFLEAAGIEVNSIYSEIYSHSTFAVVVEELQKSYDTSDDDAIKQAKTFINVLFQELERLSDPKFLSEMVNLLISELNGEPLWYDIYAWIDGVAVASGTICRFFDGTEIMQPKDQYDPGDSRLTTSIKGTLKEANNKLSASLHALRLYAVASVYTFEGTISPTSFFGERTDFQEIGYRTHYGYEISSKSTKELENFYAFIVPNINQVMERKKHRFIDIALARYKEALAVIGLIANRITLSITSLEALMFKPSEREGLSRRLAQRLAILLGHFGYDPSWVYESTMRAYDVRSSYIHGGEVEDDPDLERLCIDILEITRATIVVLLQILDHDKGKVISFIDNALIDPQFKERLDKMLQDVKLTQRTYELSPKDDA